MLNHADTVLCSSYEQFSSLSEKLSTRLNKLDIALNSYPKGEMGLTSEHIRKSPEFTETKHAFNFWMKRTQQFNRVNMKWCKHRAKLKRDARMT